MSLGLKDAKFSICTTAQTAPLDQAAFDLLTFVETTGIVTMPSFRVTQNLISQDELDTDVSVMQGGFRRGETSDLVLSFKEAADAFVAAMDAAAGSQLLYAVKKELANSGGTNGSTEYAIAKITGQGGTTGGGGEDFANLVWQIGISSQVPVRKAAA